jgi:hypothetical protein
MRSPGGERPSLGGSTMRRVWMIAAALLLLMPLISFAEGTREMDFGGGFPAACADCHGPEPVHPILGAAASYERSGHNNFGNSYYANGAGCQNCHTNEGFIDYVKTGKVDADAYVANPSQQGCFTCHDPHGTGDMSLRTVKAVTLVDDEVFDGGDGNLCANCHQARRAGATEVKASPARAISSHFGGHHGPQANMLAGSGAFEFPGRTYSSSVHLRVVKDTCVACHMALPEGRYSLSPNVGGHSFNVLGEVHEEEKANTTGCLACHADIKQVPGQEIFDKTADADYDNDGTIEPLQAEVQGVLDYFVNEKGTGLLQNTNPPMFKKDAKASFHDLGSGWANSRNGDYTEAQVAALFNYKMIVEDRSLGVHNAKYTIQVLYDSIEALRPGSGTSARRPR